MQDITYENFIEKVSEIFPKYLETEFYKNSDPGLNYIFFSDFMRYIIYLINQSDRPEENTEIGKAINLINYMIEQEDKLENLAVVEGIEWLVQEKKSKEIAKRMLSEKGKKLMAEVSNTTGVDDYEKINEEKDWMVLQAYFDGHPGVISFKTTVNTEENRKNLPFQIGVAVPLLKPTDQGLPAQAEAEQLWKIEDELKSALGRVHNSILVMTITTDGMREFVFYAPEWKPKEIESTVKNVQAGMGYKHELQFMMKEDKNWETYKNFANVK